MVQSSSRAVAQIFVCTNRFVLAQKCRRLNEEIGSEQKKHTKTRLKRPIDTDLVQIFGSNYVPTMFERTIDTALITLQKSS